MLRHRAIWTQRAYIQTDHLIVSYEGGPARQWLLPPKADHDAIKQLLDKALGFAKQNDASKGQLNAIRKALTDEGYYVRKSRTERFRDEFAALSEHQKSELLDKLLRDNPDAHFHSP